MEELRTEVESLKQEVVRLTQELDQTSSEKIQSAQYGLVLLEEKESLESRCQVGHIYLIDLWFKLEYGRYNVWRDQANILFRFILISHILQRIQTWTV